MTMSAVGEELRRLADGGPRQVYFVGTVEDHDDPEKMGRLKVRIPELYGNIPKDHLPWANPSAAFGGGSNYGFFFIPPLGAKVRIRLFREHAWFPEWYGTHWFKGEGPSEGQLSPPHNYVIKTPQGHLIDMHDDGPHIRIKDKNGNFIILDSTTNELKIFALGDKTEQITGIDNSIVAGNRQEMVGNDWDVFIGGNVNIRAAGTVAIDGTAIFLNSQLALPKPARPPIDVLPLNILGPFASAVGTVTNAITEAQSITSTITASMQAASVTFDKADALLAQGGAVASVVSAAQQKTLEAKARLSRIAAQVEATNAVLGGNYVAVGISSYKDFPKLNPEISANIKKATIGTGGKLNPLNVRKKGLADAVALAKAQGQAGKLDIAATVPNVGGKLSNFNALVRDVTPDFASLKAAGVGVASASTEGFTSFAKALRGSLPKLGDTTNATGAFTGTLQEQLLALGRAGQGGAASVLGIKIPTNINPLTVLKDDPTNLAELYREAAANIRDAALTTKSNIDFQVAGLESDADTKAEPEKSEILDAVNKIKTEQAKRTENELTQAAKLEEQADQFERNAAAEAASS